ncbi:MAG: single-stranded-DNA-specific exonuclease RecJ [Phycisphaeraceae bacterium]|nr:MAG: single-stranded-DNA-specific exonuclease RecJ [Phycisphaeraceae bacterium]
MTIDRGVRMVWQTRTPSGAAIDAGGSLVERVLAARGLTGAEAQAFCTPALAGLHDPSLIPDLDRAAERILAAARAGEGVVIYGDYDVDGITATAILFHMLRAVAPDADVRTYVPHRLEEGYGLNAEAIERLVADGARVIVSVDCGITAIAPAARAKELGADLIITDHHNPPASDADLPDAFAVVHPRRPGSPYPFGDLCGAGVAYKLAWRLATLVCDSDRVTPKLRTLLVELLALGALGSIADVVPLVDENRVITRFGLERIKGSQIEGLRALVEASGLADDKIDAMAVGFRLAPRLNACGRMGHAAEAVELFTTASGARAREIADRLCVLNDERRATERRIADQAMKMAEDAGMTADDRRAIVLAHPDWHPGVIGIVCSRLVERFHRPVILLADKGDRVTGSARSVPGFNLHAAIAACESYLSSFGGHDMAAGLAADRGNLDAFTEAFTERANDAIAPEDLVGRVSYDCDAELGELSLRSVEALEGLAPFGQGNPSVRLRVRARVTAPGEPFGKMGAHLSLRLRDCSGTGPILRAIGWRWAEHASRVVAGTDIEAIVVPKVSRWNGRANVEPELVDLAPARAATV